MFIKNAISYAKRISTESETWQIAFRPLGDVPLHKGNSENFILIPNTIRYWRADPFLFKYNGVNYLFVEMFDRKKNKGVIGVAKIKNNKCGRFKVCLETEFHLSYPCIFEIDGVIYMIPECYSSGEISVYKSVDFPLKWEKCDTIKSIEAVDTTPLFDNNGNIASYFTSLYEPNLGGNDNLHIINNQFKVLPLFLNNTCVRSAGHIITHENRLIRPIQDDTGHYGNSLVFAQIDNTNPENYKEHELLRILPSDIKLLNNKNNVKYEGIHTYNSSIDYEVIDLKTFNMPKLYYFWKNRKKFIKHYIKRF